MEQNSKTHSKIVETYADDMAKIIENDKEGLVKKIIQGEEKHEMEKKNLSPDSAKNKFFIISSAMLVLVASTLLSFLFLNKNVNTVDVAEQFVPIISSEQSDFIEIDGFNKDEIITTVLNTASNTKVKDKELEAIYLAEDKTIIGLRRFIVRIKSSLVLPDADLVPDNFLMGLVNNTTKDLFILLKVRALPDIFENLRAWEGKMLFDLHGLFEVDITPETNYLFAKNFDDGIVENKNARILYDKDDKIVLMYIFADDNSIIITNTAEAAHEIMLRLSSSQIKK